jgi:NADH-quinone oxidoreductase subunit L
LSDIKSIIAFSTISQISYMFLTIMVYVLVPLYHIVVHALFKSLLFLLSGSMIHVQSNFQSIYKLKMNNYVVNISYILASSVLVISISKESIIYYTNVMYQTLIMTILMVMGGIFTMIYALKIYLSIYYVPLRSEYSIRSYGRREWVTEIIAKHYGCNLNEREWEEYWGY